MAFSVKLKGREGGQKKKKCLAPILGKTSGSFTTSIFLVVEESLQSPDHSEEVGKRCVETKFHYIQFRG